MNLRRFTLAWVGALQLLSAPAQSAEQIVSMDANVTLDSDATFLVEERILYDFGTESRHGIYRDIPVRYGRGAAADYRVTIDIESVTDQSDQPRPYVEKSAGDNLRVRIGSKDRTLTGRQEYRIRYRVRRGLLWFDDHDEFYWNATGTDWPVPIGSAQATVELPDPVGSEVRALCFTGQRGSVEAACRVQVGPQTVAVEAMRPLRERQGLTLVVSLPKGLIREPSPLSKFLDRAGDYLRSPLLIPFAVALAFYFWWRRVGRDPAGADGVPVRYAPPEGMTPAEVGTVLDEKVDMIDITATILDLAVRGYLQIEETETTRFVFLSNTDYTLHRSNKDASDLKLHESKLLSGLFGGQVSVSFSSLQEKFHSRLPGIQDALYREVSRVGGWFPARPDKVRRTYLIGAIVAAAVLLVVAQTTQSGAWVASAIGSGLVGIGFSFIMPRKTRKGRRARQEILGFQEFIERVEKDRLERIGLDDVSKFEALLPYAFVLGVADEWAETFADLYTQPPNWYVSDYGGSFQPRIFVNRVGRSLSAADTTMRSKPAAQRGSGGSGFGGGGFSGGGFGGGGGGSW